MGKLACGWWWVLGCLVALGCGGGSGTTPAPGLLVEDVSPDGIDGQGNLMPGGRVADVTLDPATPTSPRHYLAVSDMGELYVSLDDGAHWKLETTIHGPGGKPSLGSLGVRSAGAILFDPTDLTGMRVFYTSIADVNNPTRAGVYRSLDGGQTWALTGPATDIPCDRSQARPERIGVDPTDGAVFVAAECSVGISLDHGGSFTWQQLASDDNGTYGDIAAGNGKLYVCGGHAVYQRALAGTWNVIPYPAAGGLAIKCRMAAAPGLSGELFVSAFWTTMVDPGGGGYLSDFFEATPPPPQGFTWGWTNLMGWGKTNGRPLQAYTVATSLNQYRVYYGDSVGDAMQVCDTTHSPNCSAGPNPDMTGTFWNPIPAYTLHADNAEFIFGPTGEHCLLLAAGDGGFLEPGAGNCDGRASTWDYFYNLGLHAQQAYNMGATRLGAARNHGQDLYIATQDDGIFMHRADEGASVWSLPAGSDAYLSEAAPDEQAGVSIETIWFNNAPGVVRRAQEYLQNSMDLPMPPAPYTFNTGGEAPGQRRIAWFDKKIYALVTRMGAASQVFTTQDLGDSWQPAGSLLSDVPGRTVAFEDVRASGDYGGGPLGSSGTYYVRSGGNFVRYQGLGASATTRDASGGQELSTFGVSRLRPDRVYATTPAGAAVSTLDGGMSWKPDLVLTRLLGSDAFAHVALPGPQAVTIEFQPADDKIIAVGSATSGLLVSVDDGASWGRVPGSVVPAVVTSIAFRNQRGDFTYSTYGSGVWHVVLGATQLSLVYLPTVAAGAPLDLAARLGDLDDAPVAGKVITYQVVDSTGTVIQSAMATTDQRGACHVSVTVATPGSYTVRARYAIDETADGNALVGSEAERTLTVQ